VQAHLSFTDSPRKSSVRWPAWIAHRCGDTAMAVILAAGVAKAFDIPSFATALASWTLLPRPVIPPLALAVPNVEIGLALLWFFRLARPVALPLAAVLLIAFSVALLIQFIVGGPPTCGCFGKWEFFYSRSHEARVLLARNAVLLGLIAVAMFLPRISYGGAQPVPFHVNWQRAGRRGFTLVEVLLAIGLSALLLVLLLPSLSNMRQRSRQLASMANLRSHGTVLAAYAADWREAFPHFTRPGATFTVIRCEVRDVAIKIVYFESHGRWNYALADAYYEGDFDHPSFYPPEVTRATAARAGPTGYFYGCAFIAHPEFWDPLRRRGVNQLRTTRSADVSLPSQKSLLVTDTLLSAGSAGYRPRRYTGILFVDGSAKELAVRDIRGGVQDGDGFVPGWMHVSDHPEGMHTIDGVRGRDIR
jgi:prepilin-type N-terminal cleavage/methylation domain-containing protein